jgi:hypothetical protein
MKDCVKFLKWLHRKGIPFKEWWTIRVVNNTSIGFSSHWKTHFVISNDFYDSLVWCFHLSSLRRSFSSSTHVVIIMDLVITLWMTNFILLNKIFIEIVGIVFRHNKFYFAITTWVCEYHRNKNHRHICYDCYYILMSIMLVTIMIP